MNSSSIVIKPSNWSRVEVTHERDLPSNAIKGNFSIAGQSPLDWRVIAIEKESWGSFICKIALIALLSLPIFTLYCTCSEWSKIFAGRSVTKIYVMIDIVPVEQERKSDREREEVELESKALIADVDAAKELNPAVIKKIALLFTRAIHEQYTTTEPESNGCSFALSFHQEQSGKEYCSKLISPYHVQYQIGNKQGSVSLTHLFDAIDWHRPEKCWRSISDKQWSVFCSKPGWIAHKIKETSKSTTFPFITIYTRQECFVKMNRLLRSHEVEGWSDCAKEIIFTSLYAAGGLSQLPPDDGIKEVTRGINLPSGLVSMIYKPGETIVEGAFVSTSMSNGAGLRGNVQFRIKPLEVGSAGKRIEDLSCMPGERERLFPPRTPFSVKKVLFDRDQQGEVCLIEMEELPVIA